MSGQIVSEKRICLHLDMWTLSPSSFASCFLFSLSLFLSNLYITISFRFDCTILTRYVNFIWKATISFWKYKRSFITKAWHKQTSLAERKKRKATLPPTFNMSRFVLRNETYRFVILLFTGFLTDIVRTRTCNKRQWRGYNKRLENKHQWKWVGHLFGVRVKCY